MSPRYSAEPSEDNCTWNVGVGLIKDAVGVFSGKFPLGYSVAKDGGEDEAAAQTPSAYGQATVTMV